MSDPEPDAPRPADVLLLYVTAPDLEVAGRLGRALLDEGLAACVNLLPGIVSLYRWHGQVQRDEEVLLLAKTTRARAVQAVERVVALHPYDLPCAVLYPAVGGLDAYLAWVGGETGAAGPS